MSDAGHSFYSTDQTPQKDIEAHIKVKRYFVREVTTEEICDLHISTHRHIDERNHGPFYFSTEGFERMKEVRERLGDEGYKLDRMDENLYRKGRLDCRIALDSRLVDLEDLPLRIVRKVRYSMKLANAQRGKT